MLTNYMKNCLFSLILLINTPNLPAQINPQHIQIARDSWGVPHIFAPTDPEVAYGLAWAHAEDDFSSIQENILAGKGRLAEVMGKDGALFDFALQFFQIDTLVESRYYTDLGDKFRTVTEGYAEGLNAYAAKFPKQVLLKNVFPIVGKDVIKGYMLSLTLMAGAGLSFKAVHDNMIETLFQPNEKGSNAMALSPRITEDGKTWLLVNSHQPIEGRFAWYEAHLCSEEGWNMLGGLFPGGVTVFVGTNEHLGWAHTNNFHNFGDIYKLTINPDNKNQYLYDGQYIDFQARTAKLKVKLAGIKIPVKKKILISEYGPVYKNKAGGYYAFRMPAAMDIRAGEQWYDMNKAQNFNEFDIALKSMAIPMFNVIYGDREENIMMFSAGRIAKRDTALKWSNPIDGISSKYKWSEVLPYSAMPHNFNPTCGYVYNANNSPYHATCEDEYCNIYFPGLQLFDYNRGERFGRLLGELSTASWADFNRIKYDMQIDPNGSYIKNFKALYNLDELKYPKIADAITRIKQWDKSGSLDSKYASLGILTNKFLATNTNMPYAYLMIKSDTLPEDVVVDALSKARKYMLRKYNTLDKPLSEIQFLKRGDLKIPIGGMAEVNRACDTKLFNKHKGLYKMTNGDGYIQMIKYSRDSIEIETINSYGASSHPDNIHYADQMQMFVNQKMKPMTLNKEEVLQTAKRLYHPQ